MKRIAIFCVIYNSYNEYNNYIRSIEEAVRVSGEFVVDVFVADNTTDNRQAINTTSTRLNIKVKQTKQNLGYFGGVQSLMKDVDCTRYDYVIISNVDVMMESDTLVNLIKKEPNDNVGWIAPQIYSMKENRDRNPKIVNRYSKRKLMILRLMYQYPLLHCLYNATLYKRKKISIHDAGYIYGGHGSFIILTKEYIKRCGKIDYPVFLFDEEIYLAEMCRMNNLLVEYDPTIKVSDIDHVSTSNMKSRFYNKCNIEAIDYILTTFYRA